MKRDSEGGFIGTVGRHSDLESDAPICYINNHQQCFLIAKTAKEFLKVVDSWKRHLNHIAILFFTVRKPKLKKNLNLLRFQKWN